MYRIVRSFRCSTRKFYYLMLSQDVTWQSWPLFCTKNGKKLGLYRKQYLMRNNWGAVSSHFTLKIFAQMYLHNQLTCSWKSSWPHPDHAQIALHFKFFCKKWTFFKSIFRRQQSILAENKCLNAERELSELSENLSEKLIISFCHRDIALQRHASFRHGIMKNDKNGGTKNFHDSAPLELSSSVVLQTYLYCALR